MVEQTSKSRTRAGQLERIRHVAWAGAIAFVLMLPSVFGPIDQLGWTAQSRIASEAASGDIVFVGSDADLSDPDLPRGREQLADLLGRLDSAGVESVYVDYVFDHPTEPEIDSDLNAALREFSGEAYLIRDLETGLNGQLELTDNLPVIGEGVENVGSEGWVNYLGYIWEMPYRVSHGDEDLPNLSAHLAGVTEGHASNFPVNYGFDLESIPTYRFADLMGDKDQLSALRGKTVVIGTSALRDAQGRNIPGHISVPPAIVSIYGAETLKAGYTRYFGGMLALVLVIGALLLASVIRPQGARYAVYAAIVSAIPMALIAGAHLGARVSVADAGVMLALFGYYRMRASWKQKLRLVDAETGLPTFAALEADTEVSELVPAVIVAKIHRFEEVRRTLPAELHADYMLAITARLRAATQDATIYLGQGHMIAWTMPEKDPPLLREHLEGLRALFSSPLVVGDQQVDVGITFGIDISPSPAVARRLAAAVAVAEKTTETFEPIAIADSASQEDLIWNISLQARIDAALANGEIYLAYQPKIMVQTGEIIGAEALVRWNDPVKGHIPPDYFIRQCETAGRMSQLTRFVLEEACEAGNAFKAAGLNLPIAVNISATLLHERSIVQMVSDVLERSGFEPNHLTLEITETFRISNLDLAAEILGELKALGTKISMDDFGVGAASLEALLRLPFSELKIDRLFISPMTRDPKALGIVRSILQMGKELRIIVVAEGVEDAGTLTLLRDSGCLVAQGFAISKPVTFDKILYFHESKETHALKNMV